MRPPLVCIVNVLAVGLVTTRLVDAQATTTRVSVDSGGAQANGGSNGPVISANGRYVAFDSLATNLIATDTNGVADVFVRDRQTLQVMRVSVDSSGAQADNTSNASAISADGRYVAFESTATNLVPSDTNGVGDIFVRDRQSGLTTRASVDSSNAQCNGDSHHPSLSADGRYVAFHSNATNLVSGDTNGAQDVFVRDRQSGTTTRASVSSAGVQAFVFFSSSPSISADGRYVAFYSVAANLVTGDTNGAADIFTHDIQSGQTVRVSVDSSGAQANGNSFDPALSGDGRYVAFHSTATSLVSGDTNGAYDVFVRDVQSGQTTRVSVASAGAQGDAASFVSSIAPDGRYVAFYGLATNLAAGDTNGFEDAFVRDRMSGQTLRVSLDSSGAQGGNHSLVPSLSADGSAIAFASDATNLVTSDSNAARDVFLRDSGAPPIAFCTAGTTTHGCVPSISGAGTPSASSGVGFTIAVSAVEGQKQGILFYGLNNSGFAQLPWGPSTSYLCIKPPTQRTGAQSSGGATNACNGALAVDWNAFIAANPSALGNPFLVGQHVFAQGWFRDPPSPKTTMLSNALEFVVQP